MADIRYVQRDGSGQVVRHFANPQPAMGEKALPSDHQDIIAFESPVPAIVTPLQARKALRQAGLKAAVDVHVATLSEEEQKAWEDAAVFERANPALNAAAAAMRLADGQADDLFLLAATP